MTDTHNDLEKIMGRKQRGGAYRPRGLVNRGSGRIDRSTGNLRLPVDDVLAVLGRNEYVVNAGAVRKVGTKFLDKLNNTGLGKSTLPRGTGMYGNYQRGGRVRRKFNVGGHTHNQFINQPHTHTFDGMNPYSGWTPNQITGNADYIPGQPGSPIVPESGGAHNHPGRNMQSTRRRGGRTQPTSPARRMQTGGACPQGQHMMPNGQCMNDADMPTGGGYRNGGRTKPVRQRRPRIQGKQMGGRAGYYDPYSEQRGGISSIKAIIGRGGMGPSGDQTMEHDVTDCVKSNLQGRLGQICQNYILIQ